MATNAATERHGISEGKKSEKTSSAASGLLAGIIPIGVIIAIPCVIVSGFGHWVHTTTEVTGGHVLVERPVGMLFPGYERIEIDRITGNEHIQINAGQELSIDYESDCACVTSVRHNGRHTWLSEDGTIYTKVYTKYGSTEARLINRRNSFIQRELELALKERLRMLGKYRAYIK